MRKGEASASSAISRSPVHISCSHHISGSATPEDPSNRSSLKPIQVFPELSVKIPPIVIVHKLRIIAKDDNSGRSHAHLIAVVNLGLGTIASCRWWLQYKNREVL